MAVLMAGGHVSSRGAGAARSARRVRGARWAARRGARAGAAGCWWCAGEAGVGKTALLEYPIAVGVGSDCRYGRLGWSRRWSWRSPVCISCARRCSIALERLPGPQRDALADHVRAERRARAGSVPRRAWRSWACCPRSPRSARSCVWSTTPSGWTRPPPRHLAFVARTAAGGLGRCLLFAAREPGDELRGLPELEVRGSSRGRCPAAADLGDSGGRSTNESRDQIVAETRGNPLALLELPRGLDGGPAGGRLRAGGCPSAVGADRGELRSAAGGAARGVAAVVVGRGRRAGRRSAAGVARGRAARDRRRGGGRRRHGWVAHTRRAGHVPSSAGALGGLPVGVGGAAPGRAFGAGRGDRPRARPGPPCLAPGRGGLWTR